MQEARELANDPCTDYSAAPLEDDIFEWHCTLRGPAGTEYEGGLYHFRILLPAEYPFRPPSLMMLTPNGRFELNTKICISFTSYHEELWQPAWGVRTAILGLQGFFPLKGQAAVGVGSIEYPSNERKRLATLSREWVCPHCQQTNLDMLPDPTDINSTLNDISDPASPPPVKTNESVIVEEIPTTTPSPLPTSSRVEAGGAMDTAGPQGSDSGPATFVNVVDTPAGRAQPLVVNMRRSSLKPPMLLDTAICILLVLLFAIICRRMV